MKNYSKENHIEVVDIPGELHLSTVRKNKDWVVTLKNSLQIRYNFYDSPSVYVIPDFQFSDCPF